MEARISAEEYKQLIEYKIAYLNKEDERDRAFVEKNMLVELVFELALNTHRMRENSIALLTDVNSWAFPLDNSVLVRLLESGVSMAQIIRKITEEKEKMEND